MTWINTAQQPISSNSLAPMLRDGASLMLSDLPFIAATHLKQCLDQRLRVIQRDGPVGQFSSAINQSPFNSTAVSIADNSHAGPLPRR